MDIFLGWSGDESKAVALALKGWLKQVVQSFKPWISDDIDKGTRWSEKIAAKLRESKAGVFVLTPDNLASSWVHFEAGAISNVPDARVCTFLRRLTAANIEPPLGDFQHTRSNDREDVLRLVKTLWQRAGGAGLSEKELEASFEMWWPKLQEDLGRIPEGVTTAKKPDPSEMVEETLLLVREVTKRLRKQSFRWDLEWMVREGLAELSPTGPVSGMLASWARRGSLKPTAREAAMALLETLSPGQQARVIKVLKDDQSEEDDQSEDEVSDDEPHDAE